MKRTSHCIDIVVVDVKEFLCSNGGMVLTARDFTKIKNLLLEVLKDYPNRVESDEKFNKVYNTLDKVMGRVGDYP